MASIPKAATRGGTKRKSGPTYPTAAGGSRVSVSSDRGGRRIGPTHCAASGNNHPYHR